MDLEYVQKLQKWVEYDNKILQNKDALHEVSEKKKAVEDEILGYIEKHKFDKFTVNISDGHIKFAKRNVTQPLSMKVLRAALEKYNEDPDKEDIPVDDLLEYVSEQLEVKSKYFMKREIKE